LAQKDKAVLEGTISLTFSVWSIEQENDTLFNWHTLPILENKCIGPLSQWALLKLIEHVWVSVRFLDRVRSFVADWYGLRKSEMNWQKLWWIENLRGSVRWIKKKKRWTQKIWEKLSNFQSFYMIGIM
jgi:hypothetical protein